MDRACARLQERVEQMGVVYVATLMAADKSKQEVLEVINNFPALPGLLKECQSVLTAYDYLVKMKEAVNDPETTDIQTMSKSVGNIINIASYDREVLESLLPAGVPEALKQYVEKSVSSLQAFVESMNVEIADLKQVMATYRPAKTI